MDTTGSLVVCKNDKAHQSLSEQLKVHSIRRIYVAIVHGNIKEDSGTVNAPIGRPFKGLQGQTLHARTLGIIHPTTGKYLEVNAPLPEYFIELLDRLRNIYN